MGKSTVVREVLARTGADYSVSVTTRAMRQGEVDGRDYIFTDRAAFEKMQHAGELLEWAEVFGNFYGTPAGPVRSAIAGGRTIVLEIDVQGGLQVHKKMPEADFVLILPPSAEELRRRLSGRGSESEQSLQGRLAKAQAEIDLARSSGVYNHYVVNDDLEQAIAAVVKIVKEKVE